MLPFFSAALANGGPTRITYESTAIPTATLISVRPTEASEIRIAAGPAVDEGSSGTNVRTRSDRAGNDSIPEASPTEDNSVPRLNEPVLRWLPEIMASSEKWGVPPEILAGMIRIESQGEPGPISPSGARGLVQMMPDGLRSFGVPESLWHDPATNIDAGAWGLAWRFAAQGSWEGAIGAYLGFGCDAWGTCTDVYIRVVLTWADFYRPIIADPENSGIELLPKDWAYGPVRIFQVNLPPDLTTPEPSKTPTPTATGTTTATPEAGEPTVQPTEEDPNEPTPVPTEPQPTTEIPTETPPTQVPPTVEIPTEVPTVAPPPPTEPPPPPPTEAPPPEEPTEAG
jgi:hypothetical protein